MSSIFSISTEAAPTVLGYYVKSTFLTLKAGFCLNVLIRLPKSHGMRVGLVGRCLRDNRGLSQSLKEGDNTCRLKSKSPFTFGMECVTKAAICLDVHARPPRMPHCGICFSCLWNTDVCYVSYVGICLTVQLVCLKKMSHFV